MAGVCRCYLWGFGPEQGVKAMVEVMPFDQINAALDKVRGRVCVVDGAHVWWLTYPNEKSKTDDHGILKGSFKHHMLLVCHLPSPR
eukprot:1183255-Prorocentrum_minimum.AAC.2